MSEAQQGGGRWAWWVGARYLRSRHDNRFVDFISGLSMAGIALGVAVLVAVLSVMNGFERELQSRILGVAAHATLEGLDGRLRGWEAVRDETAARPGVVAVAPYVEARAMLVSGQRSAAVELRGVLPDEEARVSSLQRHVRDGGMEALEEGSYRILLGRVLAEEQGLVPGDTVLLVVAQGTVTPAGIVPRMRRFTVAGLIDVGMYEYDRGLALVHLEDARRLLRLGGDVTGLRYALADPWRAAETVRDIALSQGGGFYVSDWSRRHGNFFRSIQVTKSIMFVVLLLIVAVAAFNIISTLVMVVKEKRGDIAILRTLGAAPRDVLAMFVVQGTAIGVVGTLAGVLLGLLIAWNVTAVVGALEGLLGITLVDPRVYFISDLPADVRPADVALVAATALLLGIAATLYPAWRAAATEPADALRHEV